MIYFDHAATTPLKEEVFEKMKPYFTDKYGNASSNYLIGRVSRYAVEEARKKVAQALGCEPRNIFFTSAGSESNNWVFKGISSANIDKGNHIITSCIEHHSILNTCKYLELNGFEVTYLPVNKEGIVSIDQLKESITDRTILISIMYANNEIGTIQPVKELCDVAKSRNIYFHTDAVQAIGNISIDLTVDNFDMLSLSAHKFYGPKGTAVLYIRDGVNIDSFIHGGSQEHEKRAGTENVAGVVGLAYAIENIVQNITERNSKVKKMRDQLINGILNTISDSLLNGDQINRLPGNISISFKGISAPILNKVLDGKGIAVSTGSACSCNLSSASHVLQSMGIQDELAQGTIRISLGEDNTQHEVNYMLEILPGIIAALRNNNKSYHKK